MKSSNNRSTTLNGGDKQNQQQKAKTTAISVKESQPEASCQEHAEEVSNRLESHGFNTRIIRGFLKDIASDDTPRAGVHVWAEALIDGQWHRVEPSASSKRNPGDVVVCPDTPESYNRSQG